MPGGCCCDHGESHRGHGPAQGGFGGRNTPWEPGWPGPNVGRCPSAGCSSCRPGWTLERGEGGASGDGEEGVDMLQIIRREEI